MNDVVVIGAGPAGISASIYLKREGFKPLLIEKGEVGGLLLNANLVENYPGFPEGIGGIELVALFKKQLDGVGVKVRKGVVRRILPDKDDFRIITDDGDVQARTVIVATGSVPKDIVLNGSEKLLDKRIFFEIRDVPSTATVKRVAIIGGSDVAFDYALNLAKRGSDVQLLIRNEEPKCIPVLRERANRTPNIRILQRVSARSVREEDDLLMIECDSDEGVRIIPSDILLIACGRQPNLDVLPNELVQKIGSDDLSGIDIPGLFFAGDVMRGDFRQVGIAVGDGILTAMKVSEFLKEED